MRSDGQSLLHPYRFDDNAFVYNDWNNPIRKLNVTDQVGFLPNFSYTDIYMRIKFIGFVGQEFKTTLKSFKRKVAINSTTIGSHGKFKWSDSGDLAYVRNYQAELDGVFNNNLRPDLHMIDTSLIRSETGSVDDRFAIYFFRINESMTY